MRFGPSRFCLSLGALMCLLLAGCGDSGQEGSQVTGKILKDGQPLALSDQGVLVVTFQSLTADGQTGEAAQVAEVDNATGVYTVRVKPGKYRVAVEQMDPYPDVDKLKKAFTIAKSPIEVEVTGTQEGLDIDLAKYAK